MVRSGGSSEVDLLVVRVLPDVAAIDKTFDYLVPDDPRRPQGRRRVATPGRQDIRRRPDGDLQVRDGQGRAVGRHGETAAAGAGAPRVVHRAGSRDRKLAEIGRADV